MENNNNQSSFWQFSDNLRLQTNNFSQFITQRFHLEHQLRIQAPRRGAPQLSISVTPATAGSAARRPPRLTGGGRAAPVNDLKSRFQPRGSTADVWEGSRINEGFPAGGVNYHRGFANNNNVVVNGRVNKGGKNEEEHGGKTGKKNKSNKESNGNGENKSSVDKRFKTLPPAESLPRNETIGGYIFVCNNDTMSENLKRELFGLPPRYRDSVRAITPGLPLFLYNYSTHQLHGVFEAASFGGTNIDPSAWEDKKNPGESRFPAQVRVVTRKICEPLEEDSFRPILHHYDGPKFRLELNIPEVAILTK
ncbi:hypothetical protein MIMGU_mgv1a010649mg [Erythranthe guttata]|uniref:DCD domain-containing protein n=1 Tax=Erythranthe guttata TaxID=4155 RepID=A0A022Q5P6_ERYGU|nr:hypothetical protein MIMGU_mgv1a010649mg [Erythranthe guttata]